MSRLRAALCDAAHKVLVESIRTDLERTRDALDAHRDRIEMAEERLASEGALAEGRVSPEVETLSKLRRGTEDAIERLDTALHGKPHTLPLHNGGKP